MKTYLRGFKSMLSIVPGILPFGAVMGSVFAEANLSIFQSMSMNILVFAGASQLAAIDLMNQSVAIATVVATGLIINIRFILYSAALSPVLQSSNLLTKLFFSYCLTDQSYAVAVAHQSKLNKASETILFYFGASSCMIIAWHSSVITGYLLGKTAPESWSLEYAIPLSFVALCLPTFKNKKYVFIAIFSALCSLLLSEMPFNLGLISSALLAIGFGSLITRKRSA